MKCARRSAAVVFAMLLLTAACLAHAATDKKPHTLYDKVEAVNRSTKSIRVQGERVEGWMDAMTMDRKVDDPAILGTVKPGDQIVATGFDGDYSLRKVQLPGKKGSPPHK